MAAGSAADVQVGSLLTAATCHELRTTVRSAFDTHPVVQLWLDDVERVDAAGLGLLVGLNRFARENDATLICVNPSPYLTGVLRKLKLGRVLYLQFTLLDDRAPVADNPE